MGRRLTWQHTHPYWAGTGSDTKTWLFNYDLRRVVTFSSCPKRLTTVFNFVWTQTGADKESPTVLSRLLLVRLNLQDLSFCSRASSIQFFPFVVFLLLKPGWSFFEMTGRWYQYNKTAQICDGIVFIQSVLWKRQRFHVQSSIYLLSQSRV